MSDGRSALDYIVGDLSRDPDGRPQNLLWLGSAGLFLSMAAVEVVADGTVTPFVLLLAVVFGLGGVAESLPVDRPRLVYRVRVLAVVVGAVVFALALVEIFGGPNLLFGLAHRGA